MGSLGVDGVFAPALERNGTEWNGMDCARDFTIPKAAASHGRKVEKLLHNSDWISLLSAPYGTRVKFTNGEGWGDDLR